MVSPPRRKTMYSCMKYDNNSAFWWPPCRWLGYKPYYEVCVPPPPTYSARKVWQAKNAKHIWDSFVETFTQSPCDDSDKNDCIASSSMRELKE